MENFIKQYPETDGNWLYRNEGEIRLFSNYIIRPLISEPWLECTDEEKEQWEKEHNQNLE